MSPCFWMIRPPRAADGPVGRGLWNRLLARLLVLALIFLAASLMAAR